MVSNANERLIKIREELGLSQRDFCKNIYLSQPYYNNVENGVRPINDRIIALICSQYGVNKEYILNGKGEIFSNDLPDIQLQQLLEVFNELEKPFKEYIVLQIKQLMEAVNTNKESKGKGKGKKPAP